MLYRFYMEDISIAFTPFVRLEKNEWNKLFVSTSRQARNNSEIFKLHLAILNKEMTLDNFVLVITEIT